MKDLNWTIRYRDKTTKHLYFFSPQAQRRMEAEAGEKATDAGQS